MAQESVSKNPKDARTNTLIFNVLAELDTDRTLGKFHQAADAIDLDLVVPRTGHGPEVVHLVVEAAVVRISTKNPPTKSTERQKRQSGRSKWTIFLVGVGEYPLRLSC